LSVEQQDFFLNVEIKYRMGSAPSIQSMTKNPSNQRDLITNLIAVLMALPNGKLLHCITLHYTIPLRIRKIYRS
jgi:hypothetical protein